MSDEREAREAIRALNGTKLNGNSLNVEVSVIVLTNCKDVNFIFFRSQLWLRKESIII